MQYTDCTPLSAGCRQLVQAYLEQGSSKGERLLSTYLEDRVGKPPQLPAPGDTTQEATVCHTPGPHGTRIGRGGDTAMLQA